MYLHCGSHLSGKKTNRLLVCDRRFLRPALQRKAANKPAVCCSQDEQVASPQAVLPSQSCTEVALHYFIPNAQHLLANVLHYQGNAALPRRQA